MRCGTLVKSDFPPHNRESPFHVATTRSLASSRLKLIPPGGLADLRPRISPTFSIMHKTIGVLRLVCGSLVSRLILSTCISQEEGCLDELAFSLPTRNTSFYLRRRRCGGGRRGLGKTNGGAPLSFSHSLSLPLR